MLLSFYSVNGIFLSIFTLYEANIPLWRSRKPDGVQCAQFLSVIATIMDQKVQLLKSLNKRELNNK
jgi:hypothetical protein